jgi:hypothetical protein
MFFCVDNPTDINVEGIMLFGMILSVINGKNILGMLSLKSIPYSDTLKKLLLGFAKLLEEPMFPRPEISKVSAPLNTFLIVSEALTANPIS